MKLPFESEIILENEVALLRPLSFADLSVLTPFSENEPELWTYSLQPGDGQENLRRYVGQALKDRALARSYPFLVIDKRNGEVAGSTRFYDYQPHHNTVQLGFTWYGKKFQGTGLNKNCKFLMLNYAFDSLKLDRVEFRADALNARSIAAMKSIGCTEEGVLRSNCASPTGRRDSIILSILASEWKERVKVELMNQISKVS